MALRDPATASAVAKCIIYKLDPNSAIAWQTHPMECKWCRYPFDKKLDALAEFVIWAGFNGDPPVLTSEVRAFMALPRKEQARQATIAAGYTPNEYGEPLLAEGKVEGGESFISDKKEARARPSAVPAGGLGGRAGDSQRESGRERGTTAAKGAGGRGLPDPEAPSS